MPRFSRRRRQADAVAHKPQHAAASPERGFVAAVMVAALAAAMLPGAAQAMTAAPAAVAAAPPPAAVSMVAAPPPTVATRPAPDAASVASGSSPAATAAHFALEEARRVSEAPSPVAQQPAAPPPVPAEAGPEPEPLAAGGLLVLPTAALAPPPALTAPAATVPQEVVPWQVCLDDARRSPLGPSADGRPYDETLISRMVHRLFACVGVEAGLDEQPPSRVSWRLRRYTHVWDGAAAWGFSSLAQQVAAEAVVVAYCESKGFDPVALHRDNPWGYGGLFQMGRVEMATYGLPGSSKFDIVDNAFAAARYFVAAYHKGDPWGGWGPWAVVNTDYGGPNEGVKVPLLPRFGSSDPAFRRIPGPELPAWAVDPYSWQTPRWAGCPITGAGLQWAPAVPVERPVEQPTVPGTVAP